MWIDLAMRLIVKIGDNVPMPFEDVHHLEAVSDIAKEDHMVFVWRAAQVRPEFRPSASERAGQGCQMVTVIAQLSDEALRHGHTAAHTGDVVQNPHQISLNRGKKNRAPHAPMPWRRSSWL